MIREIHTILELIVWNDNLLMPAEESDAAEEDHPYLGAATIRHLRAFLGLARHANFTRAAQELHISQPSLTMIIRQLEDIVGASLFDRTTRSVSLTPEGQLLVPSAERLVQDFDFTFKDIMAAATRRRGRIGIAMVHSVATKVLPNVLTEFSAANPGIRTRLREGNSADVRQRVRLNEVDIGFGSKDADEPELEFEFLFRDKLCLLMRNDHPLARRQGSIMWSDLEEYDIIGVTEDTSTRSILSQIPDLPASVRAPRFEVSMNSMLASLLSAGLGVTTASSLSLFGETGKLVYRPLTEPVMWRSVYIVTRKGRSYLPAASELITLVRRRLEYMADQNSLISTQESDRNSI